MRFLLNKYEDDIK